MEILIVLVVLSAAICALTAGFSLASLSAARKIRSLSSLQSEIVEIDTCVQSLITVIRRIEGRQTSRLAREPKNPPTQAQIDQAGTSLMDKAELRRYIGLTPGKPAPHGNTDKLNSA